MAILKKDSSARRAPRVPVDLRGSVSHRGSWDVSVLDLSLGGCLLQTPGGFDSGTIVDVGVDVGARRLTAKARVVDVSLDGASLPSTMRYLVGLQFLGLPARDESELRHFLAEEVRRQQARELV
jgi:hypothetical protein